MVWHLRRSFSPCIFEGEVLNEPGVRWPQSTISLLRTLFSLLRTLFSLLRTLTSLLRTLTSLLRTLTSLLCTLTSLLRTLTILNRPMSRCISAGSGPCEWHYQAIKARRYVSMAACLDTVTSGASGNVNNDDCYHNLLEYYHNLLEFRRIMLELPYLRLRYLEMLNKHAMLQQGLKLVGGVWSRCHDHSLRAGAWPQLDLGC